MNSSYRPVIQQGSIIVYVLKEYFKFSRLIFAPKSAHNLSHLLPQCIPDGFDLLFIYLFFAFDCSLEILERKDCLYLEEKWVGDGPKIIFGGKMGKWVSNLFFCMCFCFAFLFFIFIFIFFYERKDCFYLEGKSE